MNENKNWVTTGEVVSEIKKMITREGSKHDAHLKQLNKHTLRAEEHLEQILWHGWTKVHLERLLISIDDRSSDESAIDAAKKHLKWMEPFILTGRVRRSSTNEVANINSQIEFETQREIFNWLTTQIKRNWILKQEES